jgi:hypothetical protein
MGWPGATRDIVCDLGLGFKAAGSHDVGGGGAR